MRHPESINDLVRMSHGVENEDDLRLLATKLYRRGYVSQVISPPPADPATFEPGSIECRRRGCHGRFVPKGRTAMKKYCNERCKDAEGSAQRRERDKAEFAKGKT